LVFDGLGRPLEEVEDAVELGGYVGGIGVGYISRK